MNILVVILLCSVFGLTGFLVAYVVYKKMDMSNKEVKKQAFTDPLTGGKNRHLFMYDLKKIRNLLFVLWILMVLNK